MILQQPITVFKKYETTDAPYYPRLQTVLDRIRACHSQALVDVVVAARLEMERLLPTIDPDDKDAIRLAKAPYTLAKKQLPCICFSGKFLRREDSALTQHSGLIILDFDKVDDPAARREGFRQYPFVVAAFISPSGKGVKVLVRIPAIASQHKGHFTALRKLFPDLDPSGVNESRICYDSVDKDIYVNAEATEYTDYIAPDERPPAPRPTNYQPRSDYSKLNVSARMIRESEDGQKHQTLYAAAFLAGGYVAGGFFDSSTAIQVLEAEIADKPGVDDLKAASKTIRDAIEAGMKKPIYAQEPVVQRTAPSGSKQATAVIKSASSHGFVFASSCKDVMMHQFKHGKPHGSTTHFKTLDPHFTWKPADFTLFAGRPGAGKSEFVYQLMLAKSVFDGWKWPVFTPENHPASEFYDTLIHAYVGMSVDPRYGSHQMPEAEYEAAIEFIDRHFFFLYPDTKHTVEEIENNFTYAIGEFGCQGGLIDPYNQLNRTFTERDDQFLDGFLTDRKRFSITHGFCYCMSAHPKAMRKNRDSGEYEEVDFYDLAGGAMWGNKIDNFLVPHRPYQSERPEDSTVEIIIRKIKKQKLVGIPGRVSWSFDRQTNRYMQPGIGSPFSMSSIERAAAKAGQSPMAQAEPVNYAHSLNGMSGISSFDSDPLF